MAANVKPIFCRVPDIQWGELTAANTAKDGTGTVLMLFTADATEGGRVDKVIAVPKGTNIVTVLRLFINNGLTNATPANNAMISQTTLPATTGVENAALAVTEVVLDIPLPPGYRIMAVLGTAVASGFALSAHGGKY